MSDKNTIFVQIASYRDPQLIPTLKDIIHNSDNPELLHITVCWQHGDEQSLDDFKQIGAESIRAITYSLDDTNYAIYEFSVNGCFLRLIDVDYNDSRGACWARNFIQKFYQHEKYTLQLDSHHRFIKSWDRKLISTLEQLRKDSPKPVLTAYIPSFDPDNDPAGRVMVPWQMNFDRFIPEGAVFFRPSTIENWKELKGKPIPARFYSAHFAFADGSFSVDVQHDPLYFFHGEEISIAARAYTHGYDLYHPTEIIAWHEYTRKNRTKIWDDHTTAQKIKGTIKMDWVERNNSCHLRNRILFGMDGLDPKSIDFDKYGFGTKRTLRQYEEYAGISFEYRGVCQQTLDKKHPPLNLSYSSEEEWKSLFVRSNDIRICFNKQELAENIKDYDFWYVGCHDENGVEIFRKDLVGNEIKDQLRNMFIDFRLIFLGNTKPITYTVWPHSETKGWMNKITKQVTEY